jgi:hypothetical protein
MVSVQIQEVTGARKIQENKKAYIYFAIIKLLASSSIHLKMTIEENITTAKSYI